MPVPRLPVALPVANGTPLTRSMGRFAPAAGSVLLRALTIASRFALLFGLARLLAPADVGLYGLIAGTVSFGMLVVGGEFYTYSQRELLSLPRERWSFVLQHQAVATLLLYAVLLPAQLILFWLDLLPGDWFLWYMVLLVLEHLAQELNRLLVTAGRPVTASAVLFVRTGLWIWVLLPLMWAAPASRGLSPVFTAWALGAAAAITVALAVVIRDIPGWRAWPVDWAWIRVGFRVGLLFLAATICNKAISTADRYLVQEFAGGDMLGAYVLYAGIAASITSLLDSAVFSFLYPRVVSTYQQGQAAEHRRTLRELALSAVSVSGVLAVLAAVLAPFALRWIGREVYLAQLPALWLLLVASVIQAVGMVPHYALYARRADRMITVAHASALVVFLGVAAGLAAVVPFLAVAWGLVAAMTWMAMFKLVSYRQLRARDPEE